MRSEQEFHGSLLSLERLRGVRTNDHALFHFIGTSRFEFGEELNLRRAVFHHKLTGRAIAHRPTNFDETHAAHADRLKFWMMAKDGDVDPNRLGGICYTRSFRDCYLYAIYCEGDLFCHNTP